MLSSSAANYLGFIQLAKPRAMAFSGTRPAGSAPHSLANYDRAATAPIAVVGMPDHRDSPGGRDGHHD